MFENVYIIIAVLTFGASIGFAIYRFMTSPKNEQLEKVRKWLLGMVAAAEKEFGSKTGQLKLSYVYDQFVRAFPKLVGIISFELFSNLVDEVLDNFKNMLKSNTEVQKYVGGEK